MLNPGALSARFPGLALKAWVLFNGSTGTVISQFNVTSVTRNSVGNYTVNFTAAIGSGSYVVDGITIGAAGVSGPNYVSSAGAFASASAQILAIRAGALADGDPTYAAFYG